MYNSDYIPLDQTVIDREVERLAQSRKSAKIYLAEAYKDKDTGGNFDIIVFHRVHKDFSRFKRIIKALEAVRMCWYEIDGDIYVNRHEFYDVIYDRSRN